MSSRSFRSLLVVLVAVGGLSACRSTPSAKRVALDVVDTLPVSETVKECIRVKIEAYPEDDLQDVAKGAAKDPPDKESEAELAKFEADLADCNTDS